jgi:hypothetical protein
MTFTEEELRTIANALYAAARKFDDYVLTLADSRMALTFKEQAKQCDSLRDRIAEMTGIC